MRWLRLILGFGEDEMMALIEVRCPDVQMFRSVCLVFSALR